LDRLETISDSKEILNDLAKDILKTFLKGNNTLFIEIDKLK